MPSLGGGNTEQFFSKPKNCNGFSKTEPRTSAETPRANSLTAIFVHREVHE
jgi:hypothetical protein